MNHSDQAVSIAFFGGEPLAVPVLKALQEANVYPMLIVCNPDTPQGRKHTITPPPIKIWAQENGIEVYQPESLDDKEVEKKLKESRCDLFVVVAYGKIIPQRILSIPTYKTINMHPSLLPHFRGPSPIRSTILADERHTGATIIELDEKLDHGPIIAQTEVTIPEEKWPLRGSELDRLLAVKGAELLLDVIPKLIEGTISRIEQNHSQATFTQKITKDMGELHIDPFDLPTGHEAYEMYLKICAFDDAPGTFFFYNGKRIKIINACMDGLSLQIQTVIPEGKKEILFNDYLAKL